MKRIYTYKKFIGRFGESLFIKNLKNKGFFDIKSNIYVSNGEIDILAMKSDQKYFFEIKTVLHETLNIVSRETNMLFSSIYSYSKHDKFIRAVGEYLEKKNIDFDDSVVLILVIIQLDLKRRNARLYFLKNF